MDVFMGYKRALGTHGHYKHIHTVVDGDDLKLIMKQGLVIFK